MSVEVLFSPRISFSHDLRETDHESSIPNETFPYPSPSLDTTGFDFDFAFIVDSHGALVRESSTADQLFSDGKLLPTSTDFAPNTEITQLQFTDERKIVTSLLKSSEDYCYCPSPVFPCSETEEKKKKKKQVKSLKEHLEDSIDIEEGEAKSDTPPPPPTQVLSQTSAIRTFWNFRRSNSLNSSNYGRNRAKLNIPSKLRLLSRSKSTGFGVSTLSAKPVKEEDEDDEKKPASPAMEYGRSFWKVKRSDSLDCDKCCQNRGGIIESLKIILLRSNSTGEVLANRRDRMEGTDESEKEKRFGIRRSSSLNCNGHNGSRGLIMDRSKSTGSASNLKQIGINNGNGKKELQRQNSAKVVTMLKKEKGHARGSFKDYYGNSNKSEKVNSVLNLPSPYISRVSVDLLGFSSLFCNSKSRKVKK